MKINKLIVLTILLISLLSIVALSQFAPISKIVSKTNQVTPSINLEQKESCITTFYDEVQDVYGNCIYYHNYTSCLNTSGTNTDCSLKQDTRSFTCKTGEVTITNNKTECKVNEYIISINKGTAVLKKQIDFSDWGPCVYNVENSCLIVTCVSLYDGAHKGQYTDCNGGKSCQRFEICDNSIKTLYKNSREDFIEEDPTFYLNRLSIREVG